MNRYQAATLFLLAAGLCIVGLLLLPCVHAAMIVVHGPITALRAFRFAALFRWLLRGCCILLAALLPLQALARRKDSAPGACLFSLNSPLRC